MYTSSEEAVLHAGAAALKPLDSSKKWESLDQDAKDILESLLHDLPERRLTAAQLLHNPWLYTAQGKLFPDEPIFAPAISPVPPHISNHIQRRQRHTQLLPVMIDPFRAHVDIQEQQPKQHMAGQQSGLHSVGHVGQEQAVVRRLHPYPHPHPYPAALDSTIPSDSAARGPHDLPATPAGPIATAAATAAAAAAACDPLSTEDTSDSLPHGNPSAKAAAVAAHGLYTAVPKPQPLDFPDASTYPYSVIPKRPSATNVRKPFHGPVACFHGPAACFHSGTPGHGQYASADSASLSHSESMPTSESLTGSTSQSGSESLRSASEYSSSVTHSSSESFARSEDSSSISDGDSLNSTSADSGGVLDVESSHEMRLDSEVASVADSEDSRRHFHQTGPNTDGSLGQSSSFNAFVQYTLGQNFLDQRTASPHAEMTNAEVRDQPFFLYTSCPAFHWLQSVVAD